MDVLKWKSRVDQPRCVRIISFFLITLGGKMFEMLAMAFGTLSPLLNLSFLAGDEVENIHIYVPSLV